MGRPIKQKYFQLGTTTTSSTLIVYSNLSSGSYSSVLLSQRGSTKFKVRQQVSSTTGVVYLSTTNAPAVNRAYLKATDISGATYYVKEIKARRVTLVQWTASSGGGASPPYTGWQFITGQSAPWTTAKTPPAGYVSLETP
jgi:hypothetical protein